MHVCVCVRAHVGDTPRWCGTYIWLQSHTPPKGLGSSLVALQGKVGTAQGEPHTELQTHRRRWSSEKHQITEPFHSVDADSVGEYGANPGFVFTLPGSLNQHQI